MGRGDKKSKKGKVWNGSYGVNRNKKAIKARLKRVASKKPATAVAVEGKVKVAAKRAPRKKEAAE